MGIDANDIHFFLHQVVSLVANSCLTFVRQYPLVFFASLCLLFFDLFLPRVFVFVFHSFPVLVILVVSVVFLLNGGRTKNTSTVHKPVVVEAEKTLNHESSFNLRNPNYDTSKDDEYYRNMFDKSPSGINDDENTKEIREVKRFLSSNIYERPAPVRRHDDTGVSKQRVHSDKKDLKNLLLAEMERNRRIESLTAKRRARKLLSMQVRNTLLNMGKNNSPSPLIGSIQIPKANPLLSHNPSLVLSPTPGSAPSVLLPAHNHPFRVPFDASHEDNKSQNPIFRRGDSFSPGTRRDFDHRNSRFDEQTSPCMPLMNEAENEMPMKVEEDEEKGRPNSILQKRDIESGRRNIEITWVASSHLNNIEENESRSREVHEVSNQDIIDVGFSSILNNKNDDIMKSDKDEDGDMHYAMYDISEDEDNRGIMLSGSEKSQMDQHDSSDEEISDDIFMESFRKLTTPKASHNTTILKGRLMNRQPRDDNIHVDHSPKEHGTNTSTSKFLEPEIEQRILLGPVPSPKSVLQQNLSTLSTSSLDHDHELINVEVRQPDQERREFEENSNGMDSSISIKIEQESSNPNQDIPTDETKGGSNINGQSIGNLDHTRDSGPEPYVFVEQSNISEIPKDVEIANPINSIEDAKEKLKENSQMRVSEDHSHSPDQLRIEIT